MCVCVCVCVCAITWDEWMLGNLAVRQSRGSDVKQCLSRVMAPITDAYMGFISEETPIIDYSWMPQLHPYPCQKSMQVPAPRICSQTMTRTVGPKELQTQKCF